MVGKYAILSLSFSTCETNVQKSLALFCIAAGDKCWLVLTSETLSKCNDNVSIPRGGRGLALYSNLIQYSFTQFLAEKK